MQDDSTSLPQSKTCSKCHQTLESSRFSKRSASSDGLAHRCKLCCAEHYQRFREANREKIAESQYIYREANRQAIRERNRQYDKANRAKRRQYYENNKRTVLAQCKTRYANNPEGRRQYYEDNKAKYRKYYEDNKHKKREYAKAYRKENPDIVRAAKRNRRARKCGNGGKVTPSEWQSILSRFDGKCARCGSKENIHMDHVVPLAKGGKHSVDNVQPLCATCNLRKHTNTEDYRGRLYRSLALPLGVDI